MMRRIFFSILDTNFALNGFLFFLMFFSSIVLNNPLKKKISAPCNGKIDRMFVCMRKLIFKIHEKDQKTNSDL